MESCSGDTTAELGAWEEIRTSPDLRITSALLYRLELPRRGPDRLPDGARLLYGPTSPSRTSRASRSRVSLGLRSRAAPCP